MLTTVRARILAFALLSVAAVAGLTFIAWMIIAKAEHTSQALVGESLEQSWMKVATWRRLLPSPPWPHLRPGWCLSCSLKSTRNTL